MKYLERYNAWSRFQIGDIVYHVNGWCSLSDDKFEVFNQTELGRYIQLKNLRTNHINTKYVDARDYLSEKEHEEEELKRYATKYNL